MPTRLVCLTLALLLPAVACRSPEGINYVCTDIAVPGIRVIVVDSVSGAAAGKGSIVVGRAGAYVDSLPAIWTASSDGPYPLAHEHPGTFTVTVKRSPYRDWSRTGIVVTADQCHVRTVDVTARLQQ